MIEKSADQDNDVTKIFFQQCQQMKSGDLCHVNSFDLQDVMTAIELMDPKMDSRMQIERKIVYLNENIEKNLLPLGEEMEYELLIGIIDETLACFVNWLRGDTLGQTVFINMYMHCSHLIQNKALLGFCDALKNIIVFIRMVICKASVAEEEDFYLSTSRMPLENCLADNKLTGMLKDADDELCRVLKSRNNNNNTDSDDLIIVALQYRIRFIRNFLLWTIVLKKYIQNNCSKLIKEAISENNRYMSLLKDLIDKLKQTVQFGIPAGKGKKNPSKEPYGLVGFELYLNQPLLPPSIPRCADIEDRTNALDYLSNLINRLIHVSRILQMDLTTNVLNGWDFIQNFGKFGSGDDLNNSSCVFSRSLLLTFYISQFSILDNNNSPSPPPLAICNNNNLINNIKVDSLKSSIRCFLRLTSWPEIEDAIKLDEKLSLFLTACADNLFQIPITHCLNRSRQRTRLELIIDAQWDLYDECTKVDHILSSFIISQKQNTINSNKQRTVRDIPPLFSSFVAVFQFRTMFDYLLSGFELNLYAPQELVAVYFVLGENVLKYYLSHYQEVQHAQQREMSKLPKVVNKKSRKLLDKEIQMNLSVIQNTVQKLQSYYDLTVGFFYATVALTVDGRLADMRTACGKYSKPDVCYEKRFAPIIGRGWFYEHASFDQFDRQLSLLMSKSLSELYETAATYFDLSRKLIDSCSPPTLPSQDIFTESTGVQLRNIAKNNWVVCRLLAKGSKSGPVSLNFDESKEKSFPLIKIDDKKKK